MIYERSWKISASISSCKCKLPSLCKNHLDSASLPIPCLAIIESWPKLHITDDQVTVPHFQCLRAYREKIKGDECILYISISITPSCFLQTSAFQLYDGTKIFLACFIPSLNTLIAGFCQLPKS